MSSFTPNLPLDRLLAQSQAHPRLKADVMAFAAFERCEHLVVHGHAPRVKVLRVVAQLLDCEPSLCIEAIHVRGASGCADFRGEVTARCAEGVERTWEFVWDCRWRAREAGLLDATGYPDQARAAREFGWRCFATWRERRSDSGPDRRG
jgi:hypothetical protein